METKTELHGVDFFAGIVLALRKYVGTKGFDFYDKRADKAAVAVFDYLVEQDIFDMQFPMRLHAIHQDSPVWRRLVTFDLGLSFMQRSGVGSVLVVAEDELDAYLQSGLPGSLDLWKHCAEIFRDTYNTGH